jgi:hypothetical protein
MGGGGYNDVKATVSNMESYFLEAKGGVIRGGASVIPRAEKKTERDEDHVSNGLAVR